MFKPFYYFGNYTEVKIKNFSVEILFEINKIEIIEKKLENSLEKEFHNIYFNNFKKIKEDYKSYHSDIVTTKNYIYNSENNLIEINIPVNENEFWLKYCFEYNSLNQKIKEEKYEWNSKKWWNYYNYNDLGKLVKEEWRSNDFALIDFNYKYDNNGNLIFKQGNYLLGQVDIFLEEKYIYDNKNRLIEKVSDDYIEKFNYGNYHDLLVEKSIVYSDKTYKIENFTYDEYGNLIELKINEKTKYSEEICNIQKWIYEIAENKNWYKATHYENGKPILITKRELIK